METLIERTVITKEVNYKEELVPFIESITGLKGQDAIEHFIVACYENFIAEPQEVLDTLQTALDNRYK